MGTITRGITKPVTIPVQHSEPDQRTGQSGTPPVAGYWDDNSTWDDNAFWED